MIGYDSLQSFIMFHDEKLENVGIKLMIGSREQYNVLDVNIDQAGEINLNEMALSLRQNYQLQPHSLLFYFDHSYSSFELLHENVLLAVHFTSLICENLITFKCEQKLSDEILANPSMTDEITRTKRSRERKIEEAFLQVEQWRYFYREGTINEHGEKIKINLDKSAQIVGVPRKTLEDYFLLFRTCKNLKFDFGNKRGQKIGVLRAFLRSQEKVRLMSQKDVDQKQFFRQLRFQLLGVKPEEELFNILKGNGSYCSSDEDMIGED